ncbi:hypothetical protein [Bacillus sp. B-jedd]|uniref:hypothetical protein n=1 Tax=Bacillus sp. B-jedd TaxID=1476857 RepID=UPI000515707E|nr:hypothetical protein [Bacillus sp. B-jedd]CEG25988.1 hypothetical protein BN1002_00826 [Bacillus sp. B-jedd]
MFQTDIFQFLDDDLAVFQSQVNLPLIRVHKNWEWKEQNREEWFLYYRDAKGNEKLINCYTMPCKTIVKSTSLKFINYRWVDGFRRAAYQHDKLVAYEVAPNTWQPAI